MCYEIVQSDSSFLSDDPYGTLIVKCEKMNKLINYKNFNGAIPC